MNIHSTGIICICIYIKMYNAYRCWTNSRSSCHGQYPIIYSLLTLHNSPSKNYLTTSFNKSQCLKKKPLKTNRTWRVLRLGPLKKAWTHGRQRGRYVSGLTWPKARVDGKFALKNDRRLEREFHGTDVRQNTFLGLGKRNIFKGGGAPRNPHFFLGTRIWMEVSGMGKSI